jgi:octaprenyl-diphosphate synthase
MAIMAFMDDILKPVKGHLAQFEKAFTEQISNSIVPDAAFLTSQRAKHLRPILFFLSQGLIRRPQKRSIPWAVLIELLHTGSLIHDDVVDGAESRRGSPSFFARKGGRLSVLTGDYLFAKALFIGVSFSRQDVMRIISQTIITMTHGELLQNTLEHSPDARTALYYRIIREKTATLFSASCELAGLIQKASSSEMNRLRRFGEAFGMGFQIRDDILDFSGDAKRLGKPTGLDIRNGQKTLPVLLALETASPAERKAVLEKMSNPSANNRKWITRFVEVQHGIDRARFQADRMTKTARSILFQFSPSVYRNALDILLEYDGERVR